MNPATTVGRHPLSTRFTAIVRIAYIDYPDAKELATVYSSILESALDDERPGHMRLEVSDPKWRSASNLSKLSGSMIDLFDQVKARFSIDDHRHYLFTPRDLTQWILGLLAEAFPDLSLQCQADSVLFADRLLQFGGQGKAQLLSRLADRLGKAHCHGGGVRHGGAIVVRSDIRSRINRGKVPNWP